MKMVILHTIHGRRGCNLDQICTVNPRQDSNQAVIIMSNGKHYYMNMPWIAMVQKLHDAESLIQGRTNLLEIRP